MHQRNAKSPEDARNQFLKISFQLRLLLVKVYCMQIYSVMPSGTLVIVNEFFTLGIIVMTIRGLAAIDMGKCCDQAGLWRCGFELWKKVKIVES